MIMFGTGIGGGFSGADEKLPGLLRERAAPPTYSRYSAKNTRICRARLGNDAGIIGAALLKRVSNTL